ncbi:hypothetical protein H8F21_13980 [Pseudomonas sp. P66]|uniref:Uncharacterized protein n=1 Tax=Pseudomonas arcuscaelestis TaxID=2710591 RepID=A0ABS2BYH7_9PSED|nr:hypothetical protein [Pseudomonas arcuscaelestis]MBM5458673.1 hypothetical protein [Pseudomonas arcuscaelestis]
MNKAEWSKFLEEKVQEKVKEGFTINNYALDAASRDKLKRDLQVQGHSIPHDDTEQAEWRDYLRQVEEGAGKAEQPASRQKVGAARSKNSSGAGEASSSSAGLWKPRRH